jgi:hypothetical protein
MKKLLFILSISLFTITAFSQGIYNNGGYIVTTSGANIYVDGGTSGGYTSAGTSYVQGNASSTLTLEGNFTNNSSTTGFINPNNVTTVFNAVAQNIGGSASTTFGNVTVSGTGTKRIDVSTAVNDLFLNGQVLFLNGFTLTIDGVISGGGSILGGQTSNLNITSASALTTGIPLQQLALNNLTMSRNNGASLSSAVELYGTLSISNGTLTTNGNLTLISNSTQTARVESITSGAVSGNVTVQRFIPGGANKRKWRLLSSPVNVTGSIALSQFIDDIHVTGTGGAGAGFDACSGCTPSIRTYNEATTGTVNNGWTNPTNITNTITTGTGVEVFVRGSRSVQDPFLNWSTPDDATIDYIGALNTGTVNKALDFTNNSQALADGFNLVGNPYASQIDWQAASGWVRTNMQNFAWVYDAVSATYGVISTTGVKTGNQNVTRYFPSGQAFFVRATTTGASLQFGEAIKVSNSPFNFYRAEQSANPLIGITLSYGDKKDMCIIEIDENSTANGRDNSDAIKFFNDKINLYTITKDGVPLAINSMNTPASIDTVGLAVWNYDSSNIQLGTHHLRFDSLATLAANFNIYLLDKHLNSVTNLKVQNNYNYEVTADATSYGSNRFKLIFDATTGIENSLINNIISVYPNPANEELHISVLNADYSNSSAKVIIRNLIGQTVLETTSGSLKNLNTIDITSLQEGAYIVEVAVEGKSIFQKFIKR